MSNASISESELESLHDEDGHLREEPQQEEETEEAEEPVQEEEEGDPQEESEDNAPLDWDSLDPRFKSAFEKASQEAQKWQKDHGKIQSRWAKESNGWKQKEQTIQQLQQKAEALAKWESILEQYPELEQVVAKEIQKRQTPFGQVEAPDYLQHDPAYKAIMGNLQPYVQSLEQRLRQFEQKTSRFDQFEQSQKQAEARQKLDTQLDTAKQTIKSMLGRDPSEEEVDQVLEYMVENKFYSNGKAAAIAVFQDKYEENMRAKYENELKEKAKKFPPRSKTVNSHRAKAQENPSSVEDAIAAAFAEQGM